MCALFLGPTKPTTWCNLCCWDIAEPGFCFETNLPPCSATAENVLFACFTELLFKSSFFQKISLMGYDDGSWCKVKKITLVHSWRLHFLNLFSTTVLNKYYMIVKIFQVYCTYYFQRHRGPSWILPDGQIYETGWNFWHLLNLNT